MGICKVELLNVILGVEVFYNFVMHRIFLAQMKALKINVNKS